MQHYRIRDELTEVGVVIRAETFTVIKETLHGYWVASQYSPNWYTFAELRKYKYIRWVSKTSYCRYCYPTIDEAMNSFKRRKHMQQSKLNLQVERVNKVVDNFDKFRSASIDDLSKGIELGHTVASGEYSWD